MDLLNSCRRMLDYAFNIAEVLSGEKWKNKCDDLFYQKQFKKLATDFHRSSLIILYS
jgi:hypothetical protein